MRTRVGIALLVVGLVVLAACGGDPSGDASNPAEGVGSFPMTVENCGREVTFDEPPERVLALGGEAGSLLWAAGATDRISTFVPIEDEPLGDAEADLLQRPQLEVPGSGDISREVIVGEEPDLVVTYGLNETTPEDLETAGINTLFVNGYCDGSGSPDVGDQPEPIDGIYADVELYGELFGTQDQAATAIADLRDRVTAVQERSSELGAGSVAAALFVSDAESPLGSYGNRGTVHRQMEFLGLTNVFADTEERYFEPSVEALIDGGPDILIALFQAVGATETEQEVRDVLAARPEIADLPAILNEDILVIDFFYTGSGILAVDGLELLAEQLVDLQ